jgi:hypothetical protein
MNMLHGANQRNTTMLFLFKQQIWVNGCDFRFYKGSI